MSKRKKHKLYCYARADQMKEHKFTDDVAVTWAMDKKEAIEKFSKLYGYADADHVSKVRYTSYGVAILTDY